MSSSLSVTSVRLNNLLVNFFSDIGDFLGGRLDGSLQFSCLRGKSLNLGSDGRFPLFKFSFLLLNDSGELFLSFLGGGVNFFTSFFRFFLLFGDLSDDGLLGLLNLLNKVGHLLLSGSNLISND